MRLHRFRVCGARMPGYSHVLAHVMVAIPTDYFMQHVCAALCMYVFWCLCFPVSYSCSPLRTPVYSMILKYMGGRIPNGITGRDACRISEWLSSAPLSPSLFYFLTPPRFPPLILVCLWYSPSFSFCPVFIFIYLPSLFHPLMCWKTKVLVFPGGCNMWSGRLRRYVVMSYISLQNKFSFALA